MGLYDMTECRISTDFGFNYMQNYEEHGYSVGFVGVCRHLEH